MTLKTKNSHLKTHKSNKLLQSFVSFVLLSFVFLPEAHGASALSNLILFDLEFNLEDSQSFQFLEAPSTPIFEVGDGEIFGAGFNGANYATSRLQTGPFNPLDPAEVYETRFFNGPVSASADPPDFSLFLNELSILFRFENRSTSENSVTVTWESGYFLGAFGDFSAASIEAFASIENKTNDTEEEITLIPFDTVANDDLIGKTPDGMFEVQLSGATKTGSGQEVIPAITELEVSIAVGAIASTSPDIFEISEPTPIFGLLALGTLGAASTLKRKLKPSKSSEKEFEGG